MQYFLFMIGVLLCLHKKTADQIFYKLWILPLIFIPVFAFLLSLYAVFFSKFEDIFSHIRIFGSALGLGGLLGLYFILPIGYFYVFLVNILAFLFRKLNWITD